MEEKEMNKQILCKLYEVAKEIVSRLRLNPGAYTANEINKLNKKGGLFDGFEGKDEAVNIEVGAFSCTFPLHSIFLQVATFEKLAGVVNNRKQVFVIEPENNHYLSKVVVRISKNDASLCNSVKMVENDITSFQNNEVICLDVPRGEACKVVAMAAKEKTGKKTTAKKDRAFSFDKIGLKVGDTIQFIDGTDVTVAENTMVEFCGEKFTLSGFARQFVPDDKKNKAGAYRGCCFFFYQGVRLDKLLKAALTKEEEEKDVQAVGTVAVVQEESKEVAAVQNESNEVATVQEVEKAVIIPISLHGTKWMENFFFSSSVPLSTSVRRSGATSSRIKFATVATIPRCVGGVAVGKGYQVAAVGTVLQGSDKVVHELPLPPPR